MITSSTVSSQSVLPTRLHYKLNQHIQYIFNLNLKCRNCLQKFVSAKSLELVSFCSCYLNLDNKLVNKKKYIIYVIQIICVCIHFNYNKIIFASNLEHIFLLLTTFILFYFQTFLLRQLLLQLFGNIFIFITFYFLIQSFFYFRMFNFYEALHVV